MANENNGLSRILKDQPETIKARVLEIAIQTEIDPEDPLYQLLEALGILKVLVEDAPKEWAETFNAFGANLDQWTEENTRLLASVVAQEKLLKEIRSDQHRLEVTLDKLERQNEEQSKKLAKDFKAIDDRLSRQGGLLYEIKEWEKGANSSLALIPSQLSSINSRSNRITPLLTIVLAAIAGAYLFWLGGQIKTRLRNFDLQPESRRVAEFAKESGNPKTTGPNECDHGLCCPLPRFRSVAMLESEFTDIDEIRAATSHVSEGVDLILHVPLMVNAAGRPFLA